MVSDRLFKMARATWHDFYKEKTGEKYAFDGKDGSQLKFLLQKIINKMIEKGFPETDENINMAFGVFLSTITTKWILENLEIPTINGKFNSIYQSAKSRQIQSNDEYYQSKYGSDQGLHRG